MQLFHENSGASKNVFTGFKQFLLRHTQIAQDPWIGINAHVSDIHGTGLAQMAAIDCVRIQ
ncbi:hypothetical protein YQ44_14515 [Janthinobacterium sp. 1_2014MBL_MicDiv]|nr:hypothetical protein YQ44_14515 [Janthinobacterium sp. 1_2014MBL_MicDiv]